MMFTTKAPMQRASTKIPGRLIAVLAAWSAARLVAMALSFTRPEMAKPIETLLRSTPPMKRETIALI